MQTSTKRQATISGTMMQQLWVSFWAPSTSFHGSPQQNDLTQMISVVVGQQQCFAQQCLACAMRNARKQIAPGIAHQLAHLLQVSQKLAYAFVPCFIARWRLCFWPIFIRPLWRSMPGIHAELQDVPLP